MEVGLLALWLPILVATVLVFVVSFFLFVVLPHHRTDFDGIDEEERFSVELRNHNLKKGQYAFPFASSAVDSKDPEYQKRVRRGPVGILVIQPNVLSPSVRQLAMQFVHFAMLTAIIAYITGLVLPPGAGFVNVFHVVGAIAFVAHAGAHCVYPIWNYFSWSFALKCTIDGILFAVATAGVFGWLWPM